MSNGLFDYVQNHPVPELPKPEAPKMITSLERMKAEQNEILDRAREVYAIYQQNILSTGTLQSEITKGLNQGENIACLFLKAMKIISYMTGDDLSYQIAEEKIFSIYGFALHQPEAIEVTVSRTQERLVRLEYAAQKAEGIEKEHILHSIDAHKRELERLNDENGG